MMAVTLMRIVALKENDAAALDDVSSVLDVGEGVVGDRVGDVGVVGDVVAGGVARVGGALVPVVETDPVGWLTPPDVEGAGVRTLADPDAFVPVRAAVNSSFVIAPSPLASSVPKRRSGLVDDDCRSSRFLNAAASSSLSIFPSPSVSMRENSLSRFGVRWP
jgi:hypothetical protein